MCRKSTEIAKELFRDHKTVKRFIDNANQTRKRCDQGVKRKISRRQMSAIKRKAVQQSLLTSKQIFEQAGVSGIARTTRCRILNTVAKPVKPSIHLPLTARHRNRRLEWAKKYAKTDFQTVLSIDECRATLDGPDGWCRGWLVKGWSKPSRVRRQQAR